MAWVCALLAMTCLAPGLAAAQDLIGTPAREAEETVAKGAPILHDAVTVNLAPAVCGVLVLQWEHRFFERFSAVLVGGAGIGTAQSTFTDMAVLEIGVQARGYAVATHHQAAGVAVEAVAGWLPSDPHRERRGLAISPRLVYKIVSDGGLTAEVQLGAAWTQRSAVQVGTGAQVSASAGPTPIHAVIVGYSF